MTFKDKDMLDELVFSFYMLLDEIQNNDLIPLSAKCLLLSNYLKIIKIQFESMSYKVGD